MPLYDDVAFEMNRVKRKVDDIRCVSDVVVDSAKNEIDDSSTESLDAPPLTWDDFLIFSVELCEMPLEKFKTLINKYLKRISRANPSISEADLQKAHT